MHKKLKNIALAALLGAGSIATAHAGLLSYQGVTFTSTWSGQVLTLEIDAASHTGDWTKAKGLAALEIDGIGDYSSVSVTAAPSGARSWTTSSSELNAKGCSGATSGQAGSRLCFFGQQIALGDNMVFSFTFSGNAVSTVDPHVKVEFVNGKGNKVGSLLSQTLPASPSTGSTTGSTNGSGSTTTTTPPTPTPATPAPTVPATPVAPAPPDPATSVPATPPASTGTAATSGGGADTGTLPATVTPPASTTLPASTTAQTGAAAATGSAIVDAPVKEIPPAADLPTTAPAATQAQTPATTGGESVSPAAVPEPESIALLLGGLGLMGLVLGRRKRG